MLALPAPAGAAVAVDCSTGPVVLSGTSETYELTGACSEVVVKGSGLTVSLPSATKLTVKASSTRITVAEDLGTAKLRGAGLTLTASSGKSVTLIGSSGKLKLTTLEVLRIKGAGNKATVKKGTTKVSVTGAGNVVKVNRKG